MSTENRIRELRIEIQNIRNTRRWSRGAIAEWCDMLINCAERELERLGASDVRAGSPDGNPPLPHYLTDSESARHQNAAAR